MDNTTTVVILDYTDTSVHIHTISDDMKYDILKSNGYEREHEIQYEDYISALWYDIDDVCIMVTNRDVEIYDER